MSPAEPASSNVRTEGRRGVFKWAGWWLLMVLLAVVGMAFACYQVFVVATAMAVKSRSQQVRIRVPEKIRSDATGTARVPVAITKEQKLFLDGQPVEIGTLAAAVASLKKTKPDLKLEIVADAAAQLSLLVKVWDALRQEGYNVDDLPTQVQKAGGQGL